MTDHDNKNECPNRMTDEDAEAIYADMVRQHSQVLIPAKLYDFLLDFLRNMNEPLGRFAWNEATEDDYRVAKSLNIEISEIIERLETQAHVHQQEQEQKPTTVADPCTQTTVPFWLHMIQECDGLEIHPVQEYRNGNFLSCEPCAPEEADFWSVYGHLREGGMECFEDFKTEAEARAFAETLLGVCPHLQEHRIWG